VRTAGVPLRGPEDEDAPDLDSPGHAPEQAEPPPESAPEQPPDGAAAAGAGGPPGAEGPPGAAGEPGAQGAGPEAAAEAPLEKEMEAEAMLAGLEQDPVPTCSPYEPSGRVLAQSAAMCMPLCALACFVDTAVWTCCTWCRML